MNIVIVVHSLTGNTLSVAKTASQKLESKGHQVTIESIVPNNENETDLSKIQLNHTPDLSAYDGIVLACPVRGFNVSGAMLKYLNVLPSLDNKKIALLVTHFFPFPWMGGTSTISRMKSICVDKNGSVIATGIINWKRSNRDAQIEKTAVKISEAF